MSVIVPRSSNLPEHSLGDPTQAIFTAKSDW